MKNEIVVALRMTVVTLVLTGLAYPLAVTGHRAGALPAPGQREPRDARRPAWSARS